MFIKKDLRKIPEILRDAASSSNDSDGGPIVTAAATAGAAVAGSNHSNNNNVTTTTLKSLHLARRKDEFVDGRVRCLTEPTHPPAIKQLLQGVESLSLYDCNVSDVSGLGPALTNLQDLCLGRNPLTTLPDDLAQLSNLQRLWLDDCHLESLPTCVLELSNLQELRVSHNCLTSLPDHLHELVELKVLCVDHNHLETLPTRLPPYLTTLQVRENYLTSLPALPTSLQLLQASSNRITTLHEPEAESNSDMDKDVEWMDLTHVYLNGNQLTHVPNVLLRGCQLLKRLNLSHNCIEELSDAFQQQHGLPDVNGICSDNVVWLVHNPVVDLLHNKSVVATASDRSGDDGIEDDDDDDEVDTAGMDVDVDDQPMEEGTAVSNRGVAAAAVLA